MTFELNLYFVYVSNYDKGEIYEGEVSNNLSYKEKNTVVRKKENVQVHHSARLANRKQEREFVIGKPRLYYCEFVVIIRSVNIPTRN